MGFWKRHWEIGDGAGAGEIPYGIFGTDFFFVIPILTDQKEELTEDEKKVKKALDFCELYGIKFDYVNENCKRNLDLYTVNCRKVSADIYIDDHSYQGQEGVEKLWCDWWNWMKENGIA